MVGGSTNVLYSMCLFEPQGCSIADHIEGGDPESQEGGGWLIIRVHANLARSQNAAAPVTLLEPVCVSQPAPRRLGDCLTEWLRGVVGENLAFESSLYAQQNRFSRRRVCDELQVPRPLH